MSARSISPTPFLTGFCGQSGFHNLCPAVVTGVDCTCSCHYTQTPVLSLVVQHEEAGDDRSQALGSAPAVPGSPPDWDLGDALQRLHDDVTVLSQAITQIPTDLTVAERCDLLGQVRNERTRLAEVESLLERDAARAFPFGQDTVEWEGGTAVRRGGKDRKEWDHDGVTRAVTAAIIPPLAVNPATGEVDRDLAALLHQAVELYAATNRPAWRTTALKPLGVNADDYCTAVPGRASVQVTLATEETA